MQEWFYTSLRFIINCQSGLASISTNPIVGGACLYLKLGGIEPKQQHAEFAFSAFLSQRVGKITFNDIRCIYKSNYRGIDSFYNTVCTQDYQKITS